MSSVRRRYRRQVRSEVNVVPYVDVMMVLLVVFMITAPLVNHSGLEVELPEASGQDIDYSDDARLFIVELDREGQIYLNEGSDLIGPLNLAQLETLTLEALAADAQQPVLVRADRMLSYGRVAAVLAQLRQSGVRQLGLPTTSSANDEN